ncbi:MAG TPA: choice-of-anchor tandem repeat GloVer-containing protein, partial [Opitutaceae bacterium]|nr:choice-of-anchor tandem repeat GloVer-containing protein [Opitutaceae bacterium]
GLPNANLVQANDGNFYGMTYEGGSTYVSINNLGEGTIFRMTPAGALTTLVSFTGANGSYPAANLVQGIDGNFYGTTTEDNVNDDGTVFKMTPAGVLTTLVYFSSTSGQYPNALVQGSDGNFYGTTEGTGSGGKDGTIFKITPAGALTTLASFDSANGNEPLAGLVQGSDGNFYGTTVLGGSSNVGVVFQLIVPSCTAAPLFSPAPGTYTGAQTVTITSATSGASIRYTMNGSTPTETTGTLYSGPVNISSTTTLNAIAFKTGMADSAVITPAYTIQSTTSSGGGSSSSSPASSDAGGGGGGGGAFDDWFLGFLAVVGIWQWKRRKT